MANPPPTSESSATPQPLRIDCLTLFPEMFDSVLGTSILKRAAETIPDPAAPDDRSRDRPPVADYHLHDIRQYTTNKHQKVDKGSYGGGPGMVIQCQPVWDAVTAVQAMDPRPATRLLTTPTGVPFTQKLARELSEKPRLMMLAGHYEGFDQRVLDRMHEEGGLLEVSIGDYVLSGGELPAMVMIDAIVRLLPGALGHADSADQDSFSPGHAGLLDHPHYTRPEEWDGRKVPDVLLSGNHAKIEQWRKEQAQRITHERRPDLTPPETKTSPKPSTRQRPTPGHARLSERASTPTTKTSGEGRRTYKGRHRFEHWCRDNQVYFITARCRDAYPAFASEQAKAVFWERFEHYTREAGFTPWVTSLLHNHYHTIGYAPHGPAVGTMMQRIHGSVAKLVNDLLPQRRRPFWRDHSGHDYFDGCIRDEKQARLAYRYTLIQPERHGLADRWQDYPHTRVNVGLEPAIKRASELNAFLEGVPYKRYLDRP